MFTIKIPAGAKRQLKQIPLQYKKSVRIALDEIKEDPFFAGKPLKRELTGRFTYKIGVYRIIYKVNGQDKIVKIITDGHRSTVYN